MMFAILALTAALAIAVYFLAQIARCLERSLDHTVTLQQSRQNERQHRRERAKDELRRAAEELADPKFKEVDYALGTGHGYRRDERILSAKTWEEVEAIVFGEDLETEKDKMDYWRSIEDREAKSEAGSA